MTRQSENLSSKSDKHLSQESQIVLKLENLLKMHFILDTGSDIFSNNFLSNIDYLDLAHLHFEIQNLPDNLNQKNFLKSNNDISLMNLVQL